MDIINTIRLINSCYDTVYESDDPVQRRYSLLTLHFMAVVGIELSENVVDTAEKLLKNDPRLERPEACGLGYKQSRYQALD